MNHSEKASPSASLMFSLLHAAQALDGRLEDAFGEVGLSMARYGVLEQLVLAGEPLALSELAARLSCVRSNMTQLVDRLEAEGLVRRVNDPDDRRSIRAELTAEGRERQAAGAEQLRKVQAAFEAALPSSGHSVLARALAALE
jgi:DNA-binding MarR family transcriptional regulator